MIYAVLHNPMIMESAATTLSVHKTLAGAYKAMKAHMIAVYNEEREFELRYGRKGLWPARKYLDWQWWGIEKIELHE